MLHVAVSVNRPKQLDQPILAQMHHQTEGKGVQITERVLRSRFQTDPAVAFQARQPVPLKFPRQLVAKPE